MTAKFHSLVYGCLLVSRALGAGAAVPAAEAPVSHDTEKAVVKVFSKAAYPDLSRPWTKAPPQEVTGTGVIIDGKRILTNAHVVQYASQVQVQANESGDKLSATVVAVAAGIDLAVLKLDDESFFAKRPPLPRASRVPKIKDAVLTYGFPTGGESLSITRGIVSRIEFVSYNVGVSGLRIQIDAAINPGNSGGPAIADGKMIGLVFSHLVGSENIGYIIPNEEIDLFLKDVAAGRPYGKPTFYDELQTLENPALRAFLKVDDSVRGTVVYRPFEAPGAGPSPLKQWDVITRIADTPIDDQGMIQAGDNLRLGFGYLLQKVAHDGTVPLTIVRAGKSQNIRMPVSEHRPLLVDFLAGAYPPYFIYGPLVLSRASIESLQLLRAKGGTTAAALGSPLVARLGQPPDAGHDELVIVPSPLFPHALSKGYGNPSGEIVKSVNGTPVKSLAQMVALLRDLKDEFVTIDFDNLTGEALVFPRAQTVAATEEILTDNSVRAQGSADMLKIWQGK